MVISSEEVSIETVKKRSFLFVGAFDYWFMDEVLPL
jgi:hypothetical protein